MTELPVAESAGSTRWACPFCVLLCDDLEPRPKRSGGGWELARGTCRPARAALAALPAQPAHASPTVDGVACDLPTALHAAAARLAASRQPLFGGLGTDVAGARALYPLACATGAICDVADGAAFMNTVRATQDRGGYTTTLAEVRQRADVIVCLAGLPGGDAADFFDRCGWGEARAGARHVVLLGGAAAERAALTDWPWAAGVTTESVRVDGDLLTTLAVLAAQLAGRAVRDVPPDIVALAERLRAARYSVLAGEPRRWPVQGALLIETANRIVATLNTSTRAAAFWLGGGGGANTVNQVFTWLSGLPLRSRAGPAGLEHEPLCFDTARLLADGAVDSVLWLQAFDAACAPPATTLPLILIGVPELAASAARPGSVFVPVSTPGIGSAGHLFRADGGVVVPLTPLSSHYASALPTAAEVLRGLHDALRVARAGVPQ